MYKNDWIRLCKVLPTALKSPDKEKFYIISVVSFTQISSDISFEITTLKSLNFDIISAFLKQLLRQVWDKLFNAQKCSRLHREHELHCQNLLQLHYVSFFVQQIGAVTWSPEANHNMQLHFAATKNLYIFFNTAMILWPIGCFHEVIFEGKNITRIPSKLSSVGSKEEAKFSL